MSTLSVGTIRSNTSSAPVIQNSSGTEIIRGCSAWVNFNGTGTVAIRASFNVSSITDVGLGNFTVNFANALPNADYAIIGMCSDNARNNVTLSSPTASSCLIATYQVYQTNAYVDPSYVCVAVFD